MNLEKEIRKIFEIGDDKMNTPRTLRADEIETRVQQCKKNGCALLLYKDSRADMKILDETFGINGWQRRHTRDNQNCIISVWDDGKQQWIEKEDTGTESNTEKEKGLASDSFKRAGVNWGIGRELYSSPFIWISLQQNEVKEYNNKYSLNFGVEFHVSKIEYDEERTIKSLEISDKNGKVRFSMNSNSIAKPILENKIDLHNYKLIEKEKADKDDVAYLEYLVKEAGTTKQRIEEKYKNKFMFKTPFWSAYIKAVNDLKAHIEKESKK